MEDLRAFGNLSFLSEAYGFFRTLMWNTTPGFWGYNYAAATCLSLMAAKLGYGQEIDHWDEMVNRDGFEDWLEHVGKRRHQVLLRRKRR